MAKEIFWNDAIVQSKRAIDNKSLVPLTTELIKTDHDFEIRRLVDSFDISVKSVYKSKNPFKNRSKPNLVTPYFLERCTTTFSVISELKLT